AGFVVLGWCLGSGYHQYWNSHFSRGTIELATKPFSPRIFLEHPEGLLGLGASLCIVLGSGDWRRMVFPFVSLWTIAAIHAVHRPYWYYYYLHFAVPLAW